MCFVHTFHQCPQFVAHSRVMIPYSSRLQKFVCSFLGKKETTLFRKVENNQRHIIFCEEKFYFNKTFDFKKIMDEEDNNLFFAFWSKNGHKLKLLIKQL